MVSKITQEDLDVLAALEGGEPDFDEFELEEGDPDLDGDELVVEDPDPEQVGPKHKKVKTSSRRGIAAVRKTMKRGGKVGGPGGHHIAKKAIALDRMLKNREISFIHVKGGRIISSTIGGNPKLRPAEVQAVQSAMFLARTGQPATYAGISYASLGIVPPAGIGASDQVIDFEASQDLIGQPFVGCVLTMEVTTLNAVLGGQFTLKVYSRASTLVSGKNSVVTEQIVFQIDQTAKFFQAMIVPGVLSGGRSRAALGPLLADPFVFANPGGDSAPASGLIVASPPQSYLGKARLFVPGDEEVESFLEVL